MKVYILCKQSECADQIETVKELYRKVTMNKIQFYCETTVK